MVNKAHELGLRVAVWTVNGLNLLEHLVEDLGVDGKSRPSSPSLKRDAG
jgi:hypothetical protein